MKLENLGEGGFDFFKLRLGALIPRSVGLLVGRSSQNYKNITKLYKTVQSVTKHFGRLSGKLRQYAGASLTESLFFLY